MFKNRFPVDRICSARHQTEGGEEIGQTQADDGRQDRGGTNCKTGR